MVNKALVLENCRGVMEHKCKLVCQHQPGSSSGRVLIHLQLDLCSILLSRSFSRSCRQLDKDSLPCSIKCFNAPIISRPLLLGIREFRGLKLLRTHYTVNGSAMLVGKEVTLPTNAPIRAPAFLKQLYLPLHLPMEPTLFLLLLSRTMLVGESTMLLWRKLRKLRMLSSVCFSSMTLLQLCYFILEHCIHSYLLCMLRSIICP
jgi:hypothetical protein